MINVDTSSEVSTPTLSGVSRHRGCRTGVSSSTSLDTAKQCFAAAFNLAHRTATLDAAELGFATAFDPKGRDGTTALNPTGCAAALDTAHRTATFNT